MVEASNKKKRKLPARYPRESEIIIFGGMEELDDVLELLADLGKNLSNLPSDITEEEWGKWIDVPITNLVIQLRKACREYERFWNRESWNPETDQNFMLSMKDSSELRWYISGVEQRRVYDPARLSCMKSLYTSLSLEQYSGGKDWIDDCINNLRYELTRYHAAALEIVQERKSVYLFDAQATLADSADAIKTGNKLRGSAKNRAEKQKVDAVAEAHRIVECFNKLHTGNRSKTQAVALVAGHLMIGKSRVWRAFNRVKTK